MEKAGINYILWKIDMCVNSVYYKIRGKSKR